MTYGFLPPLSEDRKRSLNDEVPSISGQIERKGEIERQRMLESLSWVDISHLPSTGEGGATIVQLALHKDGEGAAASTFSGGERVELYLKITSAQHLSCPIVCADFRDSKGNLIFGLNTLFLNKPIPELQVGGALVLKFGFTMPLLLRGDYGVSVAIADGDSQVHVQHHIINEAAVIHITPEDIRQHYYMVVNECCDCQIVSLVP